MENPKKMFMFQGTETLKSFLYFRKWNFSGQAQKIEQNPSWENFLYFGKHGLSNSSIKKLVILSQKKVSYVSGNEISEKNSYI